MSRATLPPHATEAEQAVLGGLMLRPERFADVDWLSGADFYDGRHRRLFELLLAMAAAGTPIDAVTVADRVAGTDDAALGSIAVQYAANTPGAANIVAYAEIVLERSRLRQVMDVGAAIVTQARAPTASAHDVVVTAGNALASLGIDHRSGGLRPISEAIKPWFQALVARDKAKSTITGLATPWNAVNNYTNGLQPGELFIVAARPSMGKSVLGFQVAVHAAECGVRAAVFSLEMRKGQFIQRSVSALGQIPHAALRDPTKMEDEWWPRVTDATTTLHRLPIVMDDAASLSAAQIAQRARREHLRAPLGLVVVDHLNLIRLLGRDKVTELGDAARTLKVLAKDLNVPVLLLCQLNRASVHSRARPTLADLRGSGEIEEIADAVFFLHREAYYDPQSFMGDCAELLVGKGRDMPTGEVLHLRAVLPQMRFEDWSDPIPVAQMAPTTPAPRARSGLQRTHKPSP
ncbi:MAG: replicative DNA helicase [Xanthomonadaceae bacterium]|jgi:replicative DNA helicase|nr:replicative DNA helicase [Xanthomonadaceae bacterium]